MFLQCDFATFCSKIVSLVFITLPIVLFAVCPILAAQTAAIDRTFVIYGDATGEGSTDTVTIRVRGPSIYAPFVWSVNISSQDGKSIFHSETNDKWMDQFFRDRGFETNCSSYRTCKERYYYRDLPHAVFSVIQGPPVTFDLTPNREDVEQTVSKFLVDQDFSKERISLAIKQVEAMLSKPKNHILCLPISPKSSKVPMIWVPSVGAFVPFYDG